MRKLVAGNWKMNGGLAALGEIDAIGAAAAAHGDVDVVVFPPFTLIAAAGGRGVAIGGQDCHGRASGAHTGCVSAAMLAEAGAGWVIVGHSERRAAQREDDATVRDKAVAAIEAGLVPIVCVGESLDDRDAGRAETVVGAQLAGSLPEDGVVVVAYEPVWAIGTGRTPTSDQIVAMHRMMRNHVGQGVRLLYGGSVSAANAADILHLDNVDGALVGGASLRATDFERIIAAAEVDSRPAGR